MRIIRLVIFLGVPLAAQLAAQWVNLPTPGIPRTSDGKPNLAAAAPKTSGGKPDFSGMWIPREVLPCNPSERGVQCTELPLTPQVINIAAGMKEGLPYQPWAAQKILESYNIREIDNPVARCIRRDLVMIVTTEKDAVRLVKFEHELRELPVFVLPIRHNFLNGEAQSFLHLIINFIKTFKRS